MCSKSGNAAHSYVSVSLDKKVDYDLAVRLATLYDYMSQRLLMANLQNDAAMREEVGRRFPHTVYQNFCEGLTP